MKSRAVFIFPLLSLLFSPIVALSVVSATTLEIKTSDNATTVERQFKNLLRKATGRLIKNDKIIFHDDLGNRSILRVKRSVATSGGKFLHLKGNNQTTASILLGRKSVAEFRINNGIYQIIDGKIIRTNESTCDSEELPAQHAVDQTINHHTPENQNIPRTAAGTTSLTQIDILVAYTNAAAFWLGGAANVEALIDLKIAEANNIVFPNSGILARLHKVGMYGDPFYNDSGNYNDLTYLTNNGDIALDQVHVLRNQLGADVTILINGGSGGIAWLMNNPSTAFAPLAFGVVGRSSLSGYTFIHEIGHIFGAHHNRENALDQNGILQQGAFPFSYGHHFQAAMDGQTYGSVMSYLGNRIPYFSHPDVSYQGTPTGIPEGSLNEANNGETLSLTMPFVTQFRCAPLEFYGSTQSINGNALAIDAQLVNNGTSIRFKLNGALPNGRVILLKANQSGDSFRRGAHLLISGSISALADSTATSTGSFEVTVPRVTGNYQFITQGTSGFRSSEAIESIICN